MIGSELGGVFFASLLIPSIVRYWRLTQIVKILDKKQKEASSSISNSSDTLEDDEKSDDDSFVEIPLTSEMEPLHFNYRLEKKSLLYFIYILLFYTITFKLIPCIILLFYSYLNDEIYEYLNQHSINPFWWSTFHTISSWNNLGMTTNPDSLVPFVHHPTIVLVSVFLNMTGNIMIPIITRLLVFCAHRIFEKKSSSTMNNEMRPFLYILKAPTRMSIYFFSSTQTKFLFVIQMLLIFLQITFFVLFYQKNDISTFLVGLAFSSFTRTAGFTLLNTKELSPPVLLTYILSMYIAAYPVVILRKVRDSEVNAVSTGILELQSNMKTIFNYCSELIFSHTLFVLL